MNKDYLDSALFLFDKFGYVSYEAEEINGKEGTIHVSVDRSNGDDFTCIVFKDKETGKMYVVNAD